MVKDIFEAIGYMVGGAVMGVISYLWLAAICFLPTVGALYLLGWLK